MQEQRCASTRVYGKRMTYGKPVLTVEAAVTTIDVVHGAWGRLWVATNFCVPKTGLKAALSCLARGVRQSGAAAGSLCKMLRTCEALETHAGRPSTWGTRS
jgi:hypothetical protein